MKNVELFLGRFQPLHNGHATVIGRMKNPVVALVKGAKSGADKTKNPLGIKDQARLIKKAYSNASVVEVPNGYIPAIAEGLREAGQEVVAVWAGEDRRSSYERQINSYNDKNPDTAFNIKFKKTFDGGKRIGGTSATIVRNAIRSDDKETFLKHMPKKLHSEWEFLRKKIK
jgi:predicted nucleotidyltransferase